MSAVSIVPIENIIIINKQRGLMFFDRSHVRVLKAAWSKTASVVGNFAYFISSEIKNDGEKREYSIMKLDMTTGQVSNTPNAKSYHRTTIKNRLKLVVYMQQALNDIHKKH